jgi:hypothetical protein
MNGSTSPMTTTSFPTSTETRPDLVIRGRSALPLIMGSVIGVIGVVQIITPILTLAAFFGQGFQDGMILNALVGAVGATLCFFLAWVVLSVPHPVLVFRADRLEVARLFGKYSTVSYAELRGDKPGAEAAKTAVRLRELSVPGWVMTAAENRAWQAELAARAPALAGPGTRG